MSKDKNAQEEDRFPGTTFKKVAYSKRYGRMELLEVTKTSDGFYLGYARLGEGEDAYCHSVFLGRGES